MLNIVPNDTAVYVAAMQTQSGQEGWYLTDNQ